MQTSMSRWTALGVSTHSDGVQHDSSGESRGKGIIMSMAITRVAQPLLKLNELCSRLCIAS